MKLLLIKTLNNLRLLIYSNNKLIYQITSGLIGYKGALRKSEYVMEKLIKKTLFDNPSLNNIHLYYKGGFIDFNFYHYNINVINIKDITHIPFNGCKLPKNKRK